MLNSKRRKCLSEKVDVFFIKGPNKNSGHENMQYVIIKHKGIFRERIIHFSHYEEGGVLAEHCGLVRDFYNLFTCFTCFLNGLLNLTQIWHLLLGFQPLTAHHPLQAPLTQAVRPLGPPPRPARPPRPLQPPPRPLMSSGFRPPNMQQQHQQQQHHHQQPQHQHQNNQQQVQHNLQQVIHPI